MTKEVMELILELNKKGQTFIIVTHNPEVAKMCQRTIMMVDGKVAK
jgi:putative ABC transport system ATP-binding protein